MRGERLFLGAAGLAGLCGVALSAVAYHGGSPQLDAAAKILLAHAPFLAVLVALAGKPEYPVQMLTVAGMLCLIGLILFCGDLALRFGAGWTLFPYAAPIGGTTLMLAWVVLGLSAFWIRRTPLRD